MVNKWEIIDFAADDVFNFVLSLPRLLMVLGLDGTLFVKQHSLTVVIDSLLRLIFLLVIFLNHFSCV